MKSNLSRFPILVFKIFEIPPFPFLYMCHFDIDHILYDGFFDNEYDEIAAIV